MRGVSAAPPAVSRGGVQYPPRSRAWTTCFILSAGMVLAFMDRGILSLFVLPMQRDLGLTDTQISLLIGLAFGVFNALFGLPLGRWADFGNRKVIAAGGVLVWSVANAACGFAQNFWQLFVARTAVGGGEGAITPASVSLIADYFPPERRGAALGVLYCGVHFGTGGVLLFGGLLWYAIGDRVISLPLLGPFHSWQAILILLGGAGLVLAPITLLIKEPPRLSSPGEMAGSATTVGDTLRYYRAHGRALLGHHIGFCFHNFALHAGAAWLPAILMRTQGWSLTRTGLVFGPILMVVAPLGAMSAGLLSDRLVGHGRHDGRLVIAIASTLAAGGAALLVGLTRDPILMTAGIAAFGYFGAFGPPLALGALQQVMPNAMRGQATAIYVCFTNIIAGGLAATLVATLTQYAFADAARTNEAFAIVAVVSTAACAITLGLARSAFRPLATRAGGVAAMAGRP